MPALTPTERTVPVGLVVCAMVLALWGLMFLLTSILFLVAPESLRDAGFGQDTPLGIRAAVFVAFGGVGALLTRNAWRLIRLRSSSLEYSRALAMAITVAFVIRIVDGGAGSWLNWLTLAGACPVAGYLTLPAVRALFRR